MKVFVFVSLVVAILFHRGNSQCVGKCFPGNGLWQGEKMITISNEFADASQASSLTVFNYFAYDEQGEKFYATGEDEDANGNAMPTKILQLNGQTPPIQYVVINGTCTEDTPQLVHIVCVPGTSLLPAIFPWQTIVCFSLFVLLFLASDCQTAR
jgi:hypothetical protein